MKTLVTYFPKEFSKGSERMHLNQIEWKRQLGCSLLWHFYFPYWLDEEMTRT